ncbi:LysR family transcriptional regulator [Actinomadura macrotermitis]|uniref:PCP degradation transcriptional activation protein n=1 Tax=Actinomadura macrotermitis TaxID=2585200 RepID=A0A7K0BLQ8_9ACTN|nr:LysR family transcriptional regulator [Actinomadura macrotermitis]MQY02006.1 PCP degradation transcriptional activation protein [Actinomadura macrotermitis]
MQSKLDLNLLVALDALLEEGSVTGAADRLHLSGPAMSRTLGRIRKALGDPVLVRSGRAMAPTPRALAIRAEVHELVQRAHGLFASAEELDPASLTGSFTLQAEEGTVATIGGRLLEWVSREAPGVTLRFLGEGPLDDHRLRRDTVDLELGVIDRRSPETRIEPLPEDRMVTVVRPGHPLAEGRATLSDWAASSQLVFSRRGRLTGPVDELLAGLGLSRRTIGSAPTVTASLLIAMETDLVAFAAGRMHRGLIERLGLIALPVPLELPPLRYALAWHARYDADAAHAWLRRLVREIVAETAGERAVLAQSPLATDPESRQRT